MRFLLRDLLWLIALVAVSVGWYAHSRQQSQAMNALAAQIERKTAELASREADLDQAARVERRLRMDLRMRGAPVELFPTP